MSRRLTAYYYHGAAVHDDPEACMEGMRPLLARWRSGAGE